MRHSIGSIYACNLPIKYGLRKQEGEIALHWLMKKSKGGSNKHPDQIKLTAVEQNKTKAHHGLQSSENPGNAICEYKASTATPILGRASRKAGSTRPLQNVISRSDANRTPRGLTKRQLEWRGCFNSPGPGRHFLSFIAQITNIAIYLTKHTQNYNFLNLLEGSWVKKVCQKHKPTYN